MVQTLPSLTQLPLAIHNPAAVLVLTIPPTPTTTALEPDTFWLWELLGRLHPLVVHFPIGLIVTAAFLEALATRSRFLYLRTSICVMLIIGAASAILSVAVGLLLARNGGYGGETLTLHQWSGIATAVVATGAAWTYDRACRDSERATWLLPRGMLGLTLVALTFAGHQGASLTHGSGYLTEVLPWNEEAPRVADATDELLVTFATTDAADYDTAELDRLNLEVRAIFAHSCYRCHSTEKYESGLILDTREGVFNGGDSGPSIVPGNASQSELVRRLHLPRGDEEAMPEKGDPLTETEITLIERWIDLGAHWADRELKIFPEAPLALASPPLPASTQFDHPIDRFVDAYFKANKLRWPDVVDDRTFIRRAYLDVVGLLPTPDQVDAFLADSSPDKRDHLVHELLDQNEAYTQHWLSFWNDLLRNDYTGTGYITGGRKQITEWLYGALHANATYDQIAKTLLNPGPESAGFIRGIQWRGVVNNSQRVEMQAAQNIAQSLMGVNLKCASCHNSFVSNLTLDEAYGFATIFADSSLEIMRCDKPTGRMSQPAFLYPELGSIDGATVEERLVQLADIIVQPANGRLYRTIVNRYWDRLLGRGLVMPVDEMDQTPWSQELLDWLASDFMEHDTDLKHLIARIMTSRAYQLPSANITTAQALVASSYRFEGPTRRRLSAEQFADAMSQLLGPVFHSVAYDPYGERLEAEWIWHREIVVDRVVLPAPGTRYFRHIFEIPTTNPLAEAIALISVDHAFTLFINGEEVASGQDWQRVHRLDLRDHLTPGTNLIAVKGTNDGELPNPAGILFSLRMTHEDGTTHTVFSNDSWKSTAETPASAQWYRPGFDDTDWSTTRRYGRFDRSHWNRLIAFRHNTAPPHLEMARASLVALNPFLKALGRPTRENVTTRRDDQATLLQALELTNGEFFYEALQQGAVHWLQQYPKDSEALTESLYRAALGRSPDTGELRAAHQLLGEEPTQSSVQDLLWAVLMLPEFQLIM